METDATYRGTVYPWQCDHVGHMNIMWYVGKFDEANWNLFARLGLTPSYLRQSGRGMAAVQQNIAYKRELLAGDIVEIRSHLLELRDKSIRFRHDMTNAETGELAASCEITAGLDNACGVAAFTLMPAEADILTVEFKTTLLAPARGTRFVFKAEVVKP